MGKYKLVITNRSTYKEIEIPENAKIFRIGTQEDADFVLDSSDYFEPISLILANKNGWQLVCGENIYIADNAAKLLVTKLNHKSTFNIYYQSSEKLAFTVQFKLNFLAENHLYKNIINVYDKNKLTIGENINNNISLQSTYTNGIEAVFKIVQGHIEVDSITRKDYLYINDREFTGEEIIKDNDFFSIEDCFFYFKNNQLIVEDNKDIVINLPTEIKGELINYPKFTRNTRIKTIINEDPIEILDPPSKPEKPKNNLVLRLLPSLGMLIAAAFMVKMGGYMIAFSLISALIAIVTTVATIIEDKKDFKKNSADRIKKYNTYIDNKQKEIEVIREEERKDLEDIFISTDSELLNLENFSPNLFDRKKVDEDFLCVRLGNGDVEAKRKINYKKQERLELEDNLQELPIVLSEQYKSIHNAPVICDLKKAGIVGICGDEAFRYEFYKKIIVDIVARHFYTDVKIALVADAKHTSWLEQPRFLPYLLNPITGQRNIACDEDSKNQLYEYLYSEIEYRKSLSKNDRVFEYNIVVFFIDELGFKTHPISKYVEEVKDLGISFIFFEELQEKLPQGCSYIIAPNDETAKLIDSKDKNKTTTFRYSIISDIEMSKIMHLLAPVYSEELSLEGNLTKNLTLFDLLEVFSAEDLNLESRWSSSNVTKSLSAPLGVSSKGPISLDLSDKAHGPHGLVAGTTGSGKSETILTYILSMATLFHPYEVGFVIIDFKGGGMANQLVNLPHLIGTITNIDGKEIDRSLKSIKAELQKRQRLFKQAGVNHIDSYIALYKSGEVKIPLPHLIIIADEFAELKAEQPEFMKELISAARIGRSLGVHLILSTQKPAGQVDDQIWSNSRFKLCLKVQSAEDSKEVIKSPLAAEIKEPGRAYLQIGNNEIFELFQSGYSGAPGKELSHVKEFKIYEIKDNGKKSLIYERKRPSIEDTTTQMTAVVNHIKQYTEANNIKKLTPICLPPLPKKIPFPQRLQRQTESGIVANIGIYDDPDNQLQASFNVNLTHENIMVIGSSQSGKTNLIQNIIKNVSATYTSDEVNFYIVDFASMFLKTYEDLNHVGGVVIPSEDEKIKNLIKFLNHEMVIRKEILLKAGVSSFSSYLEAGLKDLPQIVLIIDNLTVLREMYFEDEDDDLISVCRDGISLGISVIAANSLTAGFGYKYLSNFSRKIALFNNDSNEYTTLFDHLCKNSLDDIQGRALIEIDKELYECQTYLAFEGEKEIDKVSYIKNFVHTINTRNTTIAPRIPEVPIKLDKHYIDTNYSYDKNRFSLPMGLFYNSIEPLVLNLENLGSPLVFCGREKMGKEESLRYLVSNIVSQWSEESVICIVDNMNKELEEFKDYTNYSILHSKAVDYIKEIESVAASRYNTLSNGKNLDLSKEALLVLIINNRDAIESISKDIEACEAYENLVGKYKAMNVCIIVGQFDNNTITFASPEVSRMIGDAGHFLFFEDINAIKAVEVSYTDAKNNKKLSYGDAFYFKNNEIERVRTIAK